MKPRVWVLLLLSLLLVSVAYADCTDHSCQLWGIELENDGEWVDGASSGSWTYQASALQHNSTYLRNNAGGYLEGGWTPLYTDDYRCAFNGIETTAAGLFDMNVTDINASQTWYYKDLGTADSIGYWTWGPSFSAIGNKTYRVRFTEYTSQRFGADAFFCTNNQTLWAVNINTTSPFNTNAPITDSAYAYQYTPPVDTFPQWTNYSQNATTLVADSSYVILTANFTDDINLSMNYLLVINSTNGVITNSTPTGVWTTCETSNTSCKIQYTAGTYSVADTYSWRIYANDTADQWNNTPFRNFTVTKDENPQWISRGTNISAPWYGGAGRFYDQWSDDIGLSYGYFELYNSSHLLVNSTPAIYGSTNYDTGGWSSGYFRYDIALTIPGVYAWRTCVNDTANQWNCTPIGVNKTLIGTSPQYYDYGSDKNIVSMYDDVYLYSNWTTGGGTLNYYKLNELLPNGTWLNTSWYPFDCGDYTDCIANITSTGTISPVGMHYFTFTANNTQFGTNETPLYGINVSVEKGYYLSPGNITFLGSNSFITGEGFFDRTTTTSSTTTSITKNLPLLQAPNRDMVVLDGTTLKIFQSKSLTLLNQTPTESGSKSNIVIVKNWTTTDGYDILFFNEEEGNTRLHNIFVNSTHFINTTEDMTTSFTGYQGGQIALGCGNESCVVAYSQYNYTMWNGSHQNMSGAMYGFAFNKSYDTSTAQILYNTSYLPCFSTYRNIPIADFDGDGTEDATITWVNVNENTNKERLHIGYYNISLILNKVRLINNSDLNSYVRFTDSPDGKIYCYPNTASGLNHSDVGRGFSNTLVFNAGSNSSNLETFVSAFIEADTTAEANWDFNIYGIDFDDTSWTTYSQSGDQGIPGNIFRASVLQTYDIEVCSWGYGTGIDDNMLCASWNDTWGILEGDENAYSVSPALSYPYYNAYRTIAWSGDQDSDGFADDVINRGGVYTISGDTMTRVYAISDSQDKSIVPVLDETGYWDLTTQSATTLAYIDDGYVNGNSNITWWRIKPCIVTDYGLATWQNATPLVSFWFDVNDTNNYGSQDFVRGRIILYNNFTGNTTPITAFDSNWTAYQTAGRISINFTNAVNYTVTNATFVIMTNANGTNTTQYNYSDYFRVGTTGVLWEQCSTESGYEVTSLSTDTGGESIIEDALEEFRRWADLPKNVFWIFLMILVVGSIWFFGKDQPWIATLASVSSILGLGFVGVAIGWMSAGGLFLVMIILAVAGVLIMKKKLT